MPSYQPPKRGMAWVGYVSLVDQADTKKFKANPTIAAGDFKISIDGGALNNLTNLPTHAPGGSIWVRISITAAEMTGDNILVQCIDAAGAEWCDLAFDIQPVGQLAESYAAPGVAPTMEQAVLMILGLLGNHEYIGLVDTIYEIDGYNTAMTYLIDSITNPTSHLRDT